MPDNTNARQEFIKHIEGKILICANLQVEVPSDNYEEDDQFKSYILKANFTTEEYEQFLNSLDFTYDSGYGSQELFGIILFEDSHSYRHEYDGAEWWVNIRKPTIEEVMNFQPADY